MAVVALGLSAEKLIPPFGRLRIEISSRLRLRRRDRELIEMQCRKLFRDQVVVRIDVRQICESVCSGDRKLIGIIQAWIKKPSFTVHLQVCDERVPMCHRAPSRPSMEVYARQTERGRDQYRSRVPIRTETLPIQKQLSVKLAGAPCHKHFSDCTHINAKQICNRL